MLAVYEGQRILVIDGAHSRPVSVVGTILPGCSLATTAAKILLYKLLFRVSLKWPRVRVKNVVDDFSLQIHCPEDEIGSLLAAATLHLVIGLRTLQLPLSPPKTAYLASSATLAATLDWIWRKYKFPRKLSLRNLGTDAVSGGRRASAVQNSRFTEAM